MSFKNLVKAASEYGFTAIELIDHYNLSDEYIATVELFKARTLADRYGTLVETPEVPEVQPVKGLMVLSKVASDYQLSPLDVIEHYNLSPERIAALDEVECRCLVDEYDRALDEGPIALMARELISQKGSVDAVLAALR